MHRIFSCILLLSFITFTGCTDKKMERVGGYVAVGGFNIYYEKHGSGSTILFLHAGLQDHNMWEDQVKFFSKDHQVITIDLPYHGKTTGNDTTFLARDLVKIILDSLGIQKASFAGLSMGASVVQDFIIAYPERVDKAILISAGLNGYEKKYPIDSLSMRWYPLFDSALKAKDTTLAAKEFTKAWAEGIYRSRDSLKKPVSVHVYNTTLATLKKGFAGWPRLENNPPAFDKISSIKVPVLIIEGDRDLPYISTVSAYMAKNIAGAKHLIMKDVAHMLNMEKPDELNKTMGEFLDGK